MHLLNVDHEESEMSLCIWTNDDVSKEINVGCNVMMKLSGSLKITIRLVYRI